MQRPDTFCLIATVKDEGPWLLEWIAHNKAIGFDDIVVAWNDCSDGTDLMLKRLEKLGHLRQVENTAPYEKSIQFEAYAKTRRFAEAARATWIMALDADEFLNIHLGTGRLQDLLETQTDDTEAIIFNWRLFGDAGIGTWSDVPVCETFQKAAAQIDRDTDIKTLFRNHWQFQEISPHGPWSMPDPSNRASLVIKMPSGRVISPGFFQTGKPKSKIPEDYREWHVAQINHYAVRTRDVFTLKSRRGQAKLTKHVRHTDGYFERFNRNEVEDKTVERCGPLRRQIHDQLIADPELARLHAAACDHTAQRIRELSDQPIPKIIRSLGRQ